MGKAGQGRAKEPLPSDTPLECEEAEPPPVLLVDMFHDAMLLLLRVDFSLTMASNRVRISRK